MLLKSAVIYQTRKNMLEDISRHWEESWKYDLEQSIYVELWGVWTYDQALSRVFDISSQSKLKLRRKRRYKMVNIYANWDETAKLQSQEWLPLFKLDELLVSLKISCQSAAYWSIVNREKWLRRSVNNKEANKQAVIYVGRSLTLHIFCFMLTYYAWLHNRNIATG